MHEYTIELQEEDIARVLEELLSPGVFERQDARLTWIACHIWGQLNPGDQDDLADLLPENMTDTLDRGNDECRVCGHTRAWHDEVRGCGNACQCEGFNKFPLTEDGFEIHPCMVCGEPESAERTVWVRPPKAKHDTRVPMCETCINAPNWAERAERAVAGKYAIRVGRGAVEEG